ncbi:Group II dsDNA virus coat/capsid protein [Phytophthora cactorum]|nr:Group II dsDNA virus coat/capsid protein [Phytophthora cactorum]
MVANIVIHSPTTSLTRGTKSFTPSDVTLYRHCDYPGEQIFDEVRFEVSSNPIDSCYSEAYVIHRQLRVPTDKIIAWNRCRARRALHRRGPVLDANSTTTPVTAPVKHQVYDSYQTWKPSHRDLVLWVPLLFWFNTNISLAFLCFRSLRPATDDAKDLMFSTPQISTFDLYISNMFVPPEVHGIFIDRVVFTLIAYNAARRTPEQELRQHPPGAAEVITVSPHMDDWHPFCAVTNNSLSDGTVTGAGAMNIKYETAQMTKPQLQAHSVDVFAGFQAQFFNPYIPYQFVRAGITAPTNAAHKQIKSIHNTKTSLLKPPLTSIS